MACAWLAASLEVALPSLPSALEHQVDADRWQEVARLCASGIASPPTSSAGRLFDAAAALCGLRARASHEGQAAAELEWVADGGERGAFPLPLLASPDGRLPAALDARETVRALVDDLGRDRAVATVAARFHNGLARGTAEALAREADRRGIGLAVLTGGVFQNALLLRRTRSLLEARGLRVLVPERLPPNDGGIAFGQAAAAGARTAG
jgi:hydrogenase maturation protein HypF